MKKYQLDKAIVKTSIGKEISFSSSHPYLKSLLSRIQVTPARPVTIDAGKSKDLPMNRFDRDFNKFDRDFNKFDRDFNKFDRDGQNKLNKDMLFSAPSINPDLAAKINLARQNIFTELGQTSPYKLALNTTLFGKFVVETVRENTEEHNPQDTTPTLTKLK